jgi:hypothetical protein
MVSWEKLGAKVFAGLRSPAKKIELSDRSQIERPLAPATPQPSVIVAGLES